MENHQLLLEEVTDPALIERSRIAFARAKLNSDWLAAHWPDLLPSARGQYVAVAGQEAFIADTAQEAWRLAEAAHPEDPGAFVKYVVARKGPRIYANPG
ncbi:MAG TPA: hypothetical protein VF306_15615 [Pirellulales bacterium]